MSMSFYNIIVVVIMYVSVFLFLFSQSVYVVPQKSSYPISPPYTALPTIPGPGRAFECPRPSATSGGSESHSSACPIDGCTYAVNW